MFRAVRILQVSALFILLAGCASTRTSAVSGTEKTLPPAQRNAAGPVAIALPDAPPSIRAGASVNSSEGFLNAAGDLQPAIDAYAREVAATRGVPPGQVEALLKSARYNATVAKLMTPGATRIRRSWVTYRNRHVDPVRIKEGGRFWHDHKSILDKTANDYGVPPSIIVAIIGIETVYGRQTGDFLVLDALATLGFRNPDPARPERSQLFRDQLADLIELDHQKRLDARQVRGSFAGAMGLPQFMPGSLMRYAADGDLDGTIDLGGSAADAIASVARFLRLHGWQPGLPVFAPVILPGNAGSLVAGGLHPTLSWPGLQAQGAKERPGAAGAAWKQFPLGIVDLPDEPRNLKEYRTGTPNFFAITHYNRSYFYAASVADLARILADNAGYGWPE